jgi:hypothetical protein
MKSIRASPFILPAHPPLGLGKVARRFASAPASPSEIVRTAQAAGVLAHAVVMAKVPQLAKSDVGEHRPAGGPDAGDDRPHRRHVLRGWLAARCRECRCADGSSRSGRHKRRWHGRCRGASSTGWRRIDPRSAPAAASARRLQNRARVSRSAETPRGFLAAPRASDPKYRGATAHRSYRSGCSASPCRTPPPGPPVKDPVAGRRLVSDSAFAFFTRVKCATERRAARQRSRWALSNLLYAVSRIHTWKGMGRRFRKPSILRVASSCASWTTSDGSSLACRSASRRAAINLRWPLR